MHLGLSLALTRIPPPASAAEPENLRVTQDAMTRVTEDDEERLTENG